MNFYFLINCSTSLYNRPSRINVGSIDYLREQEKVIVSPLYVVFGTKDSIDKQFLP